MASLVSALIVLLVLACVIWLNQADARRRATMSAREREEADRRAYDEL